MSKYRCPICGATHKEQPERCRLCGQNMTNENAVPTYTGGTAVRAKQKKGIGGVALIGAAGVLIIGLLALALGFAPGNSFIDKIRDKIPGLSTKGDDGWQEVDVADGGFTASFPGQPENGYLALPSASDGRVTQAVVRLGNETLLSVSYGTVTKAPGESDKAALQRLADEWAQQTGQHIEKRTDTTFAGYPALQVDAKGKRPDGETAYQRSLLVLKGDQLYVIQSLSVYQDQPQFSRLANSVSFTS